MRRWLLPAMALAGCTATGLGAQPGTVSVAGPAGNPLADGTPEFAITASDFPANELPLQLTLQVATQGDFGGPLWADTTVVVESPGGAPIRIVVPRLLPERIDVWWRARARTALGRLVVTDGVGPRRTAAWLTLISPNGRNGSSVNTRRPTFLWTSARVLPPVPPWSYVVRITHTSDGREELTARLSDTSFVTFRDLESNTSYRWSVTATLSTLDSIRVPSFASFVILDSNTPVATVLFQNFPNPFPTDDVAATCIWFDLRAQSDVALEVLDLRGNHVATILPGRGLGTTLPPGRYGRATVGSDRGCDDRLTWDGRTDGGREVPPGVYIIRLRADGVTSQRKVLWKGR